MWQLESSQKSNAVLWQAGRRIRCKWFLPYCKLFTALGRGLTRWAKPIDQFDLRTSSADAVRQSRDSSPHWLSSKHDCDCLPRSIIMASGAQAGLCSRIGACVQPVSIPRQSVQCTSFMYPSQGHDETDHAMVGNTAPAAAETTEKTSRFFKVAQHARFEMRCNGPRSSA